jgi:diguanylate cyclase (GGDEF)-like protein
MAVTGAVADGWRRKTGAWTVALAVAAAIAFPLLPLPVRQVWFVVVAWLVFVPVAMTYPATPPALRLPWGLLLGGLLLSAGASTARRIPEVGHSLGPLSGDLLGITSEALFLGAAVGIVLRRGRYDYGGLLDASLASLAIGGLLWNVILLPQLQSSGAELAAIVLQAAIVMLMAGTLGALLRLIETDDTHNRALRRLLAAVTLNLTGFVLVAGWATGPADTLGGIAFLAAYAALTLAAMDPGVARMVRPTQVQPGGFGVGRLILMGAALVSAPVVAAIQIIEHRPSSGVVLVVNTGLIVALVMVRIGLLARQLSQSQAALRHLATHDPLTDVLNRRGFTEVLTGDLRRARDFALVFCDLNAFKLVNDRYGHAAGDWLLVEVARRLRACGGPDDVVCRLGGDEFVLLVRDAGPAQAAGIRQRILDALRTPFHYGQVDIGTSASVGTVVHDAGRRREPVSAERLIDEADAAMYADKASTMDVGSP